MIDNAAGIIDPGTKSPFLELIDQGMPDPGRDIDLDDYDLVPWSGRVLVRDFPPDAKTKGGIHLPDAAQERKSWGEVIRLPGSKSPEGVELGDILVYFVDAGDPVTAFGEGLRLLDCNADGGDILGVMMKKTEEGLTNAPDGT